MKKWFCLLIFCLLSLVLTSCGQEDSMQDSAIDEILNYEIRVQPKDDGNLLMSYHIEWRVLDDQKEGPLEWVKIGVPNQYVMQPKALSEDIKDIIFTYYSDEGSFIRCNLVKKFYKNEVAILDFSFLQTHFFTLKNDEVQYQFIPGWFDEIKVNHLAVYWDKTNVQYWNKDSKNVSTREEQENLIWETALGFGESIEVNVVYSRSSFPNLDESNSNPMKNDSLEWLPFAIFGFIVLLVIIILIIKKATSDDYFNYRGFSGATHYRGYYWHTGGYHSSGKRVSDPRVVNQSGSHSSGSSCACACACACAGGGRAGCSRKDFYQSTVEMDMLLKKLEEK